jgi:hypothetical protein
VVKEFTTDTAAVNNVAPTWSFKTYTDDGTNKGVADSINGVCTFSWDITERSYKSDCDGTTVTVTKFRAHDAIDVFQIFGSITTLYLRINSQNKAKFFDVS